MPLICGYRSGVKRMPKKSRKAPIDFAYAIRSFIGYLEGTQKSLHTIKNYKLDVQAFQEFMKSEYEGKAIRLDQINLQDLERYRDFLKVKGFKTNTRRRKILTVTQFLNYLAKRKKVAQEMAIQFPAPHKIERVPYTLPMTELVKSIRGLKTDNFLELRNRALLWTLAETGCLVSEITRLRFDQWAKTSDSSACLYFLGEKSQRTIPVSMELFQTIQELKTQSKDSPWLFLGFNKFGSLGSPITSRGIELLVQHYGPKLGFKHLTPRTFRHSAVVEWHRNGVPHLEIQTRLGLKTNYAFRSYEPLFKSNLKTTSTSEKNQQESEEPLK